MRTLTGFFRDRFGLRPRRVAQTGTADTGDIHGLDPFVGQAKDWRSWQDAIREGLDGAEKQCRRAGRAYGVAFVKRARKPVGGGYAVMTIATFARLLIRLRRAEHLLGEVAPDVLEQHAAETETDLNTKLE